MISPVEIPSPVQLAAEHSKQFGIRQLFDKDEQRAEKFSFEVNKLYVDISKTHITSELVDAYVDLAKQIEFREKRDSLFAGHRINTTEDRAVLHTLLRSPDNQVNSELDDETRERANSSKQQFLGKVSEVRDRIDAMNSPIVDLIHIGIGGSSLGPQLLSQALHTLGQTVRVHFVSNVDAHAVLEVLAQCEPERTLVFGVSKTFTTEETLLNLSTVKEWFTEKGCKEFESQFYAVTAESANALIFGVQETNIVEFPEWVGGRYSVWSAVSLSVAAAIGIEEFELFLSGAAEIDSHFRQTKLSRNIPFLLAIMDHCYVNYFGLGSRATFAYDHRLRSLVPYLQQLEMESNGKDRSITGEILTHPSCPVIWGGVGTDMQHSTFQFLHQGTHFVHTEFVLIKTPGHNLQHHHDKLLANGVAQAAALLSGRSMQELESQGENEELSSHVKKAKLFSGNRPSSTFIVDKLDAKSLGSLLAIYEHRTFCTGLFSNINSFDQMGVELGKQLANQIELALSTPGNHHQFDASTASLLAHLYPKDMSD